MLALAAGIAALLAPAPAAAAAPDPLRTADAVARTCAARELPAGASGAATDSWTAPGDGLATVRLERRPRRGGRDLPALERGAADPVGRAAPTDAAGPAMSWEE